MRVILILIISLLIGCEKEETLYPQYHPPQDITNWAARPILTQDSISDLIAPCLEFPKEARYKQDLKCQNIIYRSNQGQFNQQLLRQLQTKDIFKLGLTIFAATKNHLKLPMELSKHPSSIIRQYFAAYLRKGILGNDLQVLQQMRENESNQSRNGYILKTLDLSEKILTNQLEPWRFNHPVFDSLNQNYTYLLYNANPDNTSGFWGIHRDSTKTQVISQGIIKPSMVFDQELPRTPYFPNFWFTTDNETFHVGEDIIWDWQGLPVHAIADSKVKYISFDSSWGVFVVLETFFLGKPYSYYYGHMRNELFVRVGDTVQQGQVIGLVGEATSIENGGYRAHIHMGVEKAKFEEADIGGYDEKQKLWLSPRIFIGAYSNN